LELLECEVNIFGGEGGQSSSFVEPIIHVPVFKRIGPSQPFIPANTNMRVSSESKDDEATSKDLVSFFDVINAAERDVDAF